jgi:ubiquinone/menaquinone biosynthesis C-methylase UbiE/DNA-binding transcriptional ArsR family regulator
LKLPSRGVSTYPHICYVYDVQHAATLFRVLSDTTRLRLLRALSHERFNVSELTAILAVAQSSISRHLAMLKDAGLVAEEREGGFIYYRLRDGEDGPAAPLWAVLSAEFSAGSNEPVAAADTARMQEVLRRRREEFDPGADPRQIAPGRSWAAWARALGHLLPALDVADIGCGDGFLTLEMARWARHVTGIDRSDDALERAKTLSERRQVTNVTWKKGDLSRLPLRDESIDLAVFSQSLRYASDAERALDEAVRVLRPGGRVLILDLHRHDQAWVQARFGAQRAGFAPGELESLLQTAGFRAIRQSTGVRHPANPFVVMIASGTAPHRASVRGGDAAGRPPRNRMR